MINAIFSSSVEGHDVSWFEYFFALIEESCFESGDLCPFFVILMQEGDNYLGGQDLYRRVLSFSY